MNSVQKSEPNSELRAGAVAIVRSLREAGFEAYWAGGCVRDMLLGQEPADYDIATSALPDQVLALFPRCVEVGKAFGVIQVLRGDQQYDVATFRAEGSYSDGRRPDAVVWSNPREDVIRRDFSINGLLFDPVANEVIDFVGGEDDLRASIIRAIGNPSERFDEDALRILRALRFSARLGFRIEPKTWDALKTAVPTIVRISAERIRYELERLLREGGAQQGLAMMRELELWPLVLKEITQQDSAIKRFGTSMVLEPAVAWACLCVDQSMTTADLRAFGQRLRFSRQLTEEMIATIECAHAISRYEKLPIWDRKKLVRHTCFRNATIVLCSDSSVAESLAAAQAELATWSENDLYPPPLLTGSDLTQASYPPGPFYGQVLAELEERQLAGLITTREEAFNFVAQRSQNPS